MADTTLPTLKTTLRPSTTCFTSTVTQSLQVTLKFKKEYFTLS